MDIQSIWKLALEEIKPKVHQAALAWFSGVKPLSLEGNTFVLVAPNRTTATLLSSNYGELIQEALRKVTNNPNLKVEYRYESKDKSKGQLDEASPPKPLSSDDPLVRIAETLVRIDNQLAVASEYLGKLSEALNKLVEVLSQNNGRNSD